MSDWDCPSCGEADVPLAHPICPSCGSRKPDVQLQVLREGDLNSPIVQKSGGNTNTNVYMDMLTPLPLHLWARQSSSDSETDPHLSERAAVDLELQPRVTLRATPATSALSHHASIHPNRVRHSDMVIEGLSALNGLDGSELDSKRSLMGML